MCLRELNSFLNMVLSDFSVTLLPAGYIFNWLVVALLKKKESDAVFILPA